IGGEGDAEFQAWLATNVTPHEPKGYNFAAVTVPQGDLTPEQFRGIAEIARKYSTSRVRTTTEQDLLFRWVPDGYLYDVFKALKSLNLGEANVNTVFDVTSCPGTDSCKLGITSSMGVNRAVSQALRSPNGRAELLQDPLVRQVHIKMSGCPDGCGRHH